MAVNNIYVNRIILIDKENNVYYVNSEHKIKENEIKEDNINENEIKEYNINEK